MKTQQEKVMEWLKKHEIGGSQAWWDGEIYYSLTVKQIISIAKFIKKKEI